LACGLAASSRMLMSITMLIIGFVEKPGRSLSSTAFATGSAMSDLIGVSIENRLAGASAWAREAVEAAALAITVAEAKTAITWRVFFIVGPSLASRADAPAKSKVPRALSSWRERPREASAAYTRSTIAKL